MLCFVLRSTSLFLKKCFMTAWMDLALLIRIFTSVSLFSSIVMVEPRYLKLWVNWTFLLFGRMRSGGRLLSVVSSFAFLREFGKYMASVFDLVLFLGIRSGLFFPRFGSAEPDLAFGLVRFGGSVYLLLATETSTVHSTTGANCNHVVA
jgi:hypothetical protein